MSLKRTLLALEARENYTFWDRLFNLAMGTNLKYIDLMKPVDFEEGPVGGMDEYLKYMEHTYGGSMWVRGHTASTLESVTKPYAITHLKGFSLRGTLDVNYMLSKIDEVSQYLRKVSNSVGKKGLGYVHSGSVLLPDGSELTQEFERHVKKEINQVRELGMSDKMSDYIPVVKAYCDLIRDTEVFVRIVYDEVENGNKNLSGVLKTAETTAKVVYRGLVALHWCLFLNLKV